MSLIFNGTNIKNVKFNDNTIKKIIYNGTMVWMSEPLKPGFYDKNDNLIISWEDANPTMTDLTSSTYRTDPNSVYNICQNNPTICNIIIPNSVTSIGSIAFYNCKSLTSITIPNNVTNISTQAFYNCTSLTSVTIPDSVTSIGDNAFYNVPHIYYYGTARGWPWGAKAVN